ncbi:hypothetical protein CDAR_178911 [Caerostris darwini]|uniref:Uncharacterized protein n=1 Tax=Caerostris darwini TaxID=1538125 RepID=A0AAV4PFG4_9ARAC|nr:uncharacterized protein CDAR_178771 [Caerostris darwini]GIX95168.1 hypothetical protein CDAR_178911 [Caerostris darwini]
MIQCRVCTSASGAAPGNWAGRFPCVSEKEENGSSANVPLRRCEDRPAQRKHSPSPSHCDTMAPYVPQVDEPASFVEMPPPAYTKGYSVRLQLFRLVARTFVILITLIGTFVLLAAYIHSTSNTSCLCPEAESRFDAEPLIAEPPPSFKLRIGEDLRKAKDKIHLGCLVEKNEQVLDAMPRSGKAKLQLKGEQTIVSCSNASGKNRKRRSTPCECQCGC